MKKIFIITFLVLAFSITGKELSITETSFKNQWNFTATPDWTAYQGYTELTKKDFFRITGHKDLLKQRVDQNRKKQTYNTLAVLSVVASSVSLWYCLETDNKELGALSVGAGLGLMYVFGSKASKEHIIITPDIARQIASEYNLTNN